VATARSVDSLEEVWKELKVFLTLIKTKKHENKFFFCNSLVKDLKTKETIQKKHILE